MIVYEKIYGKKRAVYVSESNCPLYECFRPHDVPVQGARGVRSSKERYMCLTNVHAGCPDKENRIFKQKNKK